MKPALDRMIDLVVNSLSGEAWDYYDREFRFFDEVTSISGKLKDFIKKTKPEKKVNSTDTYPRSLSDITHLNRPKLTKKWPKS